MIVRRRVAVFVLGIQEAAVNPSNDLLTVREVSDYLRKSPSTIYRLTRQGRLPGKKIGGTWLFSRKSLDELVLVDMSPASATPIAHDEVNINATN